MRGTALSLSAALAAALAISCSSGESSHACNGREYDSSLYRCEQGELVGKCAGKDYYIDYQICEGGIIQEIAGGGSSPSQGGSSSSLEGSSSSSEPPSSSSFGYEDDVFGWEECSAENEGEVKAGSASGKKYVCKYGEWQAASYIDAKCHESGGCSFFVDERDSQRYAYVAIGSQTWMAEDLKYEEGSECDMYDMFGLGCDDYGKLYNWATAMGIDTSYKSSLWNGSDRKHKGICPSGWHLPSDGEWEALINHAGGSSAAAKYLKADDGWYEDYDDRDNSSKSGNGLDTYGFAAVAGGLTTGFDGAHNCGVKWWSATEDGAGNAWNRCVGSKDSVYRFSSSKRDDLTSVRCLKD
jgi:uncharacterized protein (TIGR02145 family)